MLSLSQLKIVKRAITFSSLCFSFHVSLHPHVHVLSVILPDSSRLCLLRCCVALVLDYHVSRGLFLAGGKLAEGGMNVAVTLSWSVCKGTNCAFLMSSRCMWTFI